MSRETTDILIAGGGVAGLTAAAAFGAAGFRVILADPAPPVTEEAAEGADLRTTAFLRPARELLAEAGVWEALAPHAVPLETMRIVETGAQGRHTTRDFVARDLGAEAFGWNFPNWLLRRELMGRLERLQNVELRLGSGVSGVLARTEGARVTLSDGARIDARLLVAADGRESAVRAALGIRARTLRYGQAALAFAVTHTVPHGNVSTEIHRSGGPFTLIPLPDREGRPCSSVVWMERGPEARRLAALPQAAFEAEATARSAGLAGPLSLATKRQVWPMISRVADRMTGPHTALMAESVHVIPPIGAQGLNMSLADLACLLELARAQPDRLGEADMLAAYERRRLPEIRLRVAGIDALNRTSMLGGAPLARLRGAGLALLHDIPPLRRGLMTLGLGARP